MKETFELPLRPPTQSSEFGWDMQLTALEFSVLKNACSKVFNSIIKREVDPYKRSLLLYRIPQDAAVITAHSAVVYSLDCLAKKTVGGG